MSDALFFLGLLILTAAAFVVSVALGLAGVGLGLIIVSFGLADGKGLPWR